ncbi:MAG: hypothetical protein ACK5KM_00200 [Hyphomicrobiaceae bacterium]
MRISVIIAVTLTGLTALGGCSPYHHDRYYDSYDDAYERERDRKSYRRHTRRENRQSRHAQGSVRNKERSAQIETPRDVEQRSVVQPLQDIPVPDAADEVQSVEAPAAPEVERDSATEVAAREVAKAPVVSSNPAVSTVPADEPEQPEPPREVITPEPTPADQVATVTVPAEAQPSGATGADDAAENGDAGAKKHIEDGYRLLRAGFVKKARERFEQAMTANAADASLAKGRSMDPTYLKTVSFPDVIPDADQARRMYRRAALLGNKEAKSDLTRLEQALAVAEPAILSPTTPANAAPVQH